MGASMADSPLVCWLLARQGPAMESHEWSENTDEGKVYFRANYYLSGKWTIMTTTQKRNPTWTDLVPPSEEVLRELRDIICKKYQRKRLPWERVADLDRLLGDEPLPRPQ
jgi:hypothetical protein